MLRFVRHTATVFRFLDKCVADLSSPAQTVDNFRLATRIHALQVIVVRLQAGNNSAFAGSWNKGF